MPTYGAIGTTLAIAITMPTGPYQGDKICHLRHSTPYAIVYNIVGNKGASV